MSVTVETNATVVTATIDDGKANALSPAVITQLRAAVGTAVDQDKALVITGRQGYFCAGFDLAIMKGTDVGAIAALLTEGGRLYREVLEAPIPVVAACTGHALAAGALLLLSADHRIGSRGSFKIGLNEVHIGMGLPAFAVAMARHRLSPRHLAAATILGEIGQAERAAEIGYLDEVADDALAAAAAFAERVAEIPRKPVAETKARVHAPLIEELKSMGM